MYVGVTFVLIVKCDAASHLVQYSKEWRFEKIAERNIDTMGSSVLFRTSLMISSQRLIHLGGLMGLAMFLGLANLPCFDCLLVSNHRVSVVGPPLHRQQYRDFFPQLGGRLATGSYGPRAAAGREDLATHPRREMIISRSATASPESNSTRVPLGTEAEALASFKAAITSDPSNALSSWIVGAAGTAADVCSAWVGVTCSPQSPNHVVGLRLATLQLVGSLESVLPTLGPLTFLQSLDLSGKVFSGYIPGESLTSFHRLSYLNFSRNVVTGDIPSEMGELLSLQHLDLAFNNITGPIPASLANCSLLTSLVLGSNRLEGDIPDWLGKLSSLEILNLYDNSLSGSIPDSLGNCSSLRFLDLGYNYDIGGAVPQDIGQLKKLEVLLLDMAFITGDFPVWLGNLTSLTRFSMEQNGIAGSIPDTIGQLKLLWEFSLWDVPVTGVIPISIYNMTSLQVLQIVNTNLTGHIPAQIGMLPNIYWLSLEENLFIGTIPSAIANCSTLTLLQLGYNLLMDPGPTPPWIESLKNLQTLVLGGLNLQGQIPASIGKLSNLLYITLSDNNLTGRIPVGIANCTLLNYFNLGENQLSGAIPPELGALRYLETFDLYYNDLTGPFPDFIANWTNLSTVYLNYNSLSGRLDSNGRIGQLRQLSYFTVTANELEGPIPEAIQNWTLLTSLLLNGNQLSGAVPGWLGNLTGLAELYLGTNNLQGPIPVGLFKPGFQLGQLDLSVNQLEGSIPVEIGHLGQLSWLYLFSNNLTGVIPSSLGNCSGMILLDFSYNQLEGGIPEAAILEMSASLITLNLSSNRLSGSWPKEFSRLTAVEIINVSSNNLSGSIPLGLGQCSDLNTLDISVNNLTGAIPQDLGALTRLIVFNASFNDFFGPIPQAGIFNSNRINESSFLGNPGLCGSVATIGLPHHECVAAPVNVTRHPHRCKGFACKQIWIPVAVVSICLVLGAVGVMVGIWSGWIFNRGEDDQFKKPILLNFGTLMRFTERDVLQTLDDPEGDNVIGVGARSVVYKGVLAGGQSFALKKLLPGGDIYARDEDSTFENGALHAELVKEANILVKLRHKNILKFLSFYSNLDQKALIMEYMIGGCLHNQLHQMEPCHLTWQRRLKVAMGVAQGMKYLHHDLLEPLIHRDLKPSNILLDEGFEPKVADFGIAKFVSAKRDGEATASTFCGTTGYMPPEYASQVWVSTKGDVYSYGMVVIELLTRRHPCSENGLESQGTDLRNWVLTHFHERPFELLDPSLLQDCSSDNIAKEQMIYLLRLSLFCTRTEPQSRPSMMNVVGMLAHIITLGVERVTARTVEELASDLTDHPSTWVSQDPAMEGVEFGSN